MGILKERQELNIKILLPKDLINLDFSQGQHLYFLAGPIRGANDWQHRAINMLIQADNNCYIVCPCRYNSDHELYRYALHLRKDFSIELTFNNQTEWERYYLELASYYGAIIFWLPAESIDNPRGDEDGPYARDTLGELGRWSIRSANQLGMINGNDRMAKVNLSIGAESDFPGLKVIKRNLDADHGHSFKISESLEDTILKAVGMSQND